MVAVGVGVSPRRRIRTKTRAIDCLKRPARGKSASGVSLLVSPKTDNDSSALESFSNMGAFEIKQKTEQYIVCRLLDSAMICRLHEFLKRKKPVDAKMKNEGGESDDERKARYDDRDSKVAWVDSNKECPWFQEHLHEVVKSVANVHWSFLREEGGEPIWEAEKCQYTVYGPGQHFQAWHKDAYEEGNDLEDARVYAIVVMLSPKENYTGGQFQVKVRSPNPGKMLIRSVGMDLGDAIIFPAKKLIHRVTAVGTGLRKTMVCWVNDRQSCKYYNPDLK